MRNFERRDRHFALGIRHYAIAATLALTFLVAHLPYLPSSLEDLDSINFALGLRHFDVANHQPHPPGYPIYIALGNLAHAFIPTEAQALAIIGVLAGALGAFALVAFFGRLDQEPRSGTSLLATLLTITAPCSWFTAARPLSDMAGLTAAVAVQAIALSASTPASVLLAVFCRRGDHWHPISGGLADPAAPRVRLVEASVCRSPSHGCCGDPGVHGWLCGVGGPACGPEWWTRCVRPSALQPGGPRISPEFKCSGRRQRRGSLHGRSISRSLRRGPHGRWQLSFSSQPLRALSCSRGGPRARLRCLTIAFGPYLLLDLLFQETVTTRYALPLVPPTAYLAVRGLKAVGVTPALVVAGCLAAFNAHVGGTSVAAYSRQKAPVFRMLDDMEHAAAQISGP